MILFGFAVIAALAYAALQFTWMRGMFARQSAMYLAHVTFHLTYTEVGRAFGRDRTTAAYACQVVEERRDDPAIDAVLGSLESACATLRQKLSAKVPA
jgi:hypothetical protein